MINVSSEFKNELFEGHRIFLDYVDITLKSGNVLNLTSSEIWDGGLTIEDSVSNSDSFDIGSAIINKCTITINNIYETYSEYDFFDANVVVYIGMELPSGKIEKIRKGTYTVDETQYDGSIITLSCLDYMSKFDKEYSESILTYPATLNQIVRDACSKCNVTLQTYNFPHDDFIVQNKPSEESTTFREVISWCAQIAGCFCRCDVYGRLELKWFDQEILENKDLDGGYFDNESETEYKTGDSADGGSFNPWNALLIEKNAKGKDVLIGAIAGNVLFLEMDVLGKIINMYAYYNIEKFLHIRNINDKEIANGQGKPSTAL